MVRLWRALVVAVVVAINCSTGQELENRNQVEEIGQLNDACCNSLSNQISDLKWILGRMNAKVEAQNQQLQAQNQQLQSIYEAVVGLSSDCADVRANGQNASGVYRVIVGSTAKRLPINVYCDLTSPAMSWLVFQRRKDGTENFERNWVDYTDGFGNPAGEFWLGNEALYLLTSNRKYKLRIEMEDFGGQRRYAEYSSFSISSSADNYRLSVSGYSGDAGDSLAYQNGQQFSTKDADHDTYGGNCAQQFHGAWWYTACHYSNLNGLYLRGNHTSYADGIEWHAFRGYYYSLKTVEMKITSLN